MKALNPLGLVLLSFSRRAGFVVLPEFDVEARHSDQARGLPDVSKQAANTSNAVRSTFVAEAGVLSDSTLKLPSSVCQISLLAQWLYRVGCSVVALSKLGSAALFAIPQACDRLPPPPWHSVAAPLSSQ